MDKKLDNKDRKILYELEKDSRQTDSKIAKTLGTSKQVIRYRISRLIDEGIIKTFQTSINFNKLGMNIYGTVYFKLQKINPEKERKIIDYLIRLPDVAYVASTGGRYDLTVVIFAHTLQEFIIKLNKVTSKYSSNLNNKTIALRIAAQKFNKDYLLSDKEKRIKKEDRKTYILLKEELKSLSLKKIDYHILNILTNNSRISLVEMSEIMNKPITTLHSRIKKLVEIGAISGFTLLLDLKKMNIQNYKMLITFKDQSEEIERKFYSYCQTNSNITYFFKTIAKWTHEIRIEVKNQEKYQGILKEIRNHFGNSIENIETIFVFKEYIESYSRGLGTN